MGEAEWGRWAGERQNRSVGFPTQMLQASVSQAPERNPIVMHTGDQPHAGDPRFEIRMLERRRMKNAASSGTASNQTKP